MTPDSARPETLLNRNFVLLWQAQLISQMGTQAFSLAMMYWVMETTGSASLMGLLMMVSLLPGVILGPFGGALADRHSRLVIIVVSDLARGAAVLAVASIMFLHPTADTGIVAAFFAVALFSGLVKAVFHPAITAAIPDLVPPGKVASGNSWIQFSTQASVLTGQAAGGLLYRALGPAHMLVIDGVTYLYSAISEASVRIPQKSSGDPVPAGAALSTYWEDTVAGVRYVWGHPGMRSFLVVATAVNFLAMPAILLLPFYATERLGEGPAWYGFLLAAMGAGALLGYLGAGALRIPAQRRGGAVISALLATSILLAAAGSVRRAAIALGLFLGVGAFTGAVNILVITQFQTAAPVEMRGRVMALVLALSGAAAPLGMALGGLLADATQRNLPWIYLGCGTLIGLLTLGAATHAPFRRFLEGEAPAPRPS